MNLACTGSDPGSPKFLMFCSLWICGINFDGLGITLKYPYLGTSMAILWLSLCASIARATSLIPHPVAKIL